MNEETDEYYTYENIVKRMLDNVSNDVDKREGSIIFDAIAPCALELANMYVTLKNNMDLIYVDTAVDEYLDKIVNQFGITRKEATNAIRKGTFSDSEGNLMDIPLQSRFSLENINYIAVKKIDLGIYEMECETAGIVGNEIYGDLIPIEYIPNLGTAVLEDILIPGEDEESDEDLRERYIDYITAPPFAGNVSDYRLTTKSFNGVGDLKVIPIWNGGGTVKLILLDSDYNVPTQTLINTIQEEISPVSGNTLGIAPIGHQVTVTAANPVQMSISTKIAIQNDYSISQLKEQIENVINEYLLELRKEWADQDYTIVRVSQLETRILGVEGVLDIENTYINSQNRNIQLNIDEVPVLGEVVITQ